MQRRAFYFVIVTLILFKTSILYAEIRVAFLEVRDWYGNPIVYEKGGRFAHSAIAFEDKWLHAHPAHGVELVQDISRYGDVKAIVVLPQLPDLTDAEIKPYLGLPFDWSFNWEDRASSYCSKLVGQLLDIPPEPMDFSSDYWKNKKDLPLGQMGLSPDGLYRVLSQKGYIKTP